MQIEVNRENELFTLICVKLIELFYQSPFFLCSLSSSQCLLISCLFTGMLFTIMCFQSIYAFNERDCKSIISLYYPDSLSLCFSITPSHSSWSLSGVQCFPECRCQSGMLMCIDVYEISWNLQRQH